MNGFLCKDNYMFTYILNFLCEDVDIFIFESLDNNLFKFNRFSNRSTNEAITRTVYVGLRLVGIQISRFHDAPRGSY